MAATDLSLYQEDLIIDQQPYFDIDKGRKTPYERKHGKYISKSKWGTYTICKHTGGKVRSFGTYKSFEEAREIRDQLIERDWEPFPLTLEQKQKEYYRGVGLYSYTFRVTYNNTYYGACKTIEEALYYRDLIREGKTTEKPYGLDLKKDNPYIKEGLKFPLPERLIPKRKKHYATGRIANKGPQSYHVYYDKQYFGSYCTYEYAYYVLQELRKCGFDRKELPRILDGYKEWYTWLMYFWQYVEPNKDSKNARWNVVLTPKNNGGQLHKLIFRNVEDALWERDLLVKYNFDEELVVYLADDRQNPYYDMELPPYPQRKVRGLRVRDDRSELLTQLRGLILDGVNTQEVVAEMVGMTAVTLRRIFREEFDSSWHEFRCIVESGEDPNEVLEHKKYLEFEPDISKHYDEYSYSKNYVHYHKEEIAKNKYAVQYRGKYFGAYPTRELANKISNDLQKVGWDKSKLVSIQRRHGFDRRFMSRGWVYPASRKKVNGKTVVSSWNIRKKDADRRMVNYGSYNDYDFACRVRDELVECDWDKSQLDSIIEMLKEEDE